MNDLDLLCKFEPVVRFTYGEHFFPAAVDGYVQRCSLWLRDEQGQEKLLVPQGELTLEKLASYREAPVGQQIYLRFVEKPLDVIAFERWRLRPERPVFRAVGRLTRVGLLPRLMEAFFNISLLLRGKVPGGTAAAAEIDYRAIRQDDPRYVYYGRVVREGGYIVLQYLFFYVMNDWRSSFYGVNDHEADLEQIFVYLAEEPEGEPEPRWVAFASHDFSGDDLRRRWDDPELHRFEQDHPVVYAGAGSHASYFLPGEYLMGAEPAFLRPVRQALDAIAHFWRVTLGQGESEAVERARRLLVVPYIDYARGDGFSIGPQQVATWCAVLIDQPPGWLEEYRGLWGLDTRDPLGGERAPAGPKYNRDGSVRLSWYNPLGWSGLDKVPPPGQVPAQLESKINSLEVERSAVQTEIAQKREAVRQLALEVDALQQANYLNKLYLSQQRALDAAEAELQALYARLTVVTETWLASRTYLEDVRSGHWGDPQAHIQHKHLPEPPLGRQTWLAEVWAAVSSGVLLLALTAMLYLHPVRWPLWVLLIGFTFALIEETVRGRLVRFLLNVTIFLGVLTALVLALEFWWLLLIGGLVAVVLLSVIGNLRELSGR
ncbi:MAG TPA: hypothetical protein VI776_15000 [Anaerolineales bacterium]|nr:hypothetical protein [Anaerolineales bacterium]